MTLKEAQAQRIKRIRKPYWVASSYEDLRYALADYDRETS